MTAPASPIAWQYLSPAESATLDLGRRLGEACQGGEIILLEGPLGAGKTRLAGGLARGLGIDRPVISPTYLILRSYEGARGLTLHHLDFYRLTSDADLETVGLEDCLDDRSVVVAEWPERCPHAFEAWTLALNLSIANESTRQITARLGPLPAPAAFRSVEPV